MPTYAYRAKDGPGKTVDGTMVAESRSAVLAALDQQGLMAVSVRETVEKVRRGRLSLSRPVRFHDVTLFTGQLASLTRSGVPILRAMQTIADQTENPRLRRTVESMGASIRDGNMLSSAMEEHPTLFPELYINMVRAGESSGLLAEILLRLAESREKEEDMRRKLQAAMAYPLLILVVGLTTVFALLAFFLPRVVELFRGYADLPLPTRILMGVSDFFAANWYWMVMAMLLIGFALNRLAALDKGRVFFDTFKLRLPFLGRFIKESELSRFARTFALLIDAGMPIDKSLALSNGTVRNAVLRNALEDVRLSTVEQGETLSIGLQRCAIFPAMVTNMAAVGEEGGRLDEAMTEVAVYYEKQCDQRSRLAASLVEPILILGVGALVGFIVAAMLLPIFELGTGL